MRLCSIINKDGCYLREKNDGKTVCRAQLDDAVKYCCEMSLSEREHSPYIGSDRASVFTAACVIFKSIYDELDFERLIVSFKGAQDAILQELKNGKINEVG